MEFESRRIARLSRALALVLFALAAASPARADHAEAEKVMAEGWAAEGRGDWHKAIELLTKAIELDPAWPELYALRGQPKVQLRDYLSAVDDYNRCLELDAKRTPSDPTTIRDTKMLRSQVYLQLSRVDEAFEDLEWNLKYYPDDPMTHNVLGLAELEAGHLDAAWMELNRPGAGVDPLTWTNYYALKADWKGLETRARGLKGPDVELHGRLHLVIALVEQGRFKEAQDIALEGWKVDKSNITAMACLYVFATPGAPMYDPTAAISSFRSLMATMPPDPWHVTSEGRALTLAGRYREAVDLLSTKMRYRNFDAEFWLGVALWKLDRAAEAREAFRRARRKNECMMAHASRVEGLAEFLKPIDEELVAEAKAAKDRRLGAEEIVRLASVAEIEARARRFEFAWAAGEYRRLLDTQTSPVRKAEIEARAADLEGMGTAFKRVIDAANAAKPPLRVHVGDAELEIVKADPASFDFKIPSGSGQHPWAALDAREFVKLAMDCKPTPAEQFSLGVLLWDAGALDDSWKTLNQAVTALPALRARLNALVSRRRGIPAPSAGFAYFRGGWATAAEKANLEKGLVNVEGSWVSTADAEKLGRGQKKVGDKWVSEEDAALIARGFRKEGGRWLSPKEYEDFHREWKNAWVVETAHYTIRTTQGEAFANDLGAIVELAYVEYGKFWGGREPKLGDHDKMVLFAYHDYEDYRRFCVEHRAEKMLNAAGFAQMDSTTVAGWNKLEDLRFFLQTMVHEAAHLYYWRAVGHSVPPSWLSEAMATWFEGFEWTGKEWHFTWIDPNRLYFARASIVNNTYFPFADLAKQDAGDLINQDFNKSITFYAECWSLNAFLCQTDNPAYRKAWELYRKDAERGNTAPLGKYFPDLKQLESDWKRFVAGK